MDVPHSPLRGGSMEPYNVIRRLGTGTYGSAYLVCLKSNSSMQFVLKKIRLDQVSDKEREAAEQEVQLLKTLDHAFVLQFHDAFIYKNHLCIITEYCEAGDLYSYLKGRKTLLPEAQVLEWFTQIALAVQHCHSLKVLHRDLKTQNIFLTRNGDVKLGDFGISRVLKGPTEMASTIVGTPYYMSPEILECKPYDFKSDIWSLGCVLYELSTLKHAFNATDMNGLVMKVLRGRVLPLPDCYSGALATLINKMLSKSPRGRPPIDLIFSAEFLQDVYQKTVAKATQLKSSKTRGTFAQASSDRPGMDAQPDTVWRNGYMDMPVAASSGPRGGRRSVEEPSAAARRTIAMRPGRLSEAEGAVPGRRPRNASEEPQSGELDYAVSKAEEELRRIQDERDVIRQQARAFNGAGMQRPAGGVPATPAWGPDPALPTFGGEGSLHQFIVGDEPTPKENGKHYWEAYDEWEQQAAAGHGHGNVGRSRSFNAGKRTEGVRASHSHITTRPTQPDQMGYSPPERFYERGLVGDAPALVQNMRRRDPAVPRANIPSGGAYYGSSPTEDPGHMHLADVAGVQAAGPRERMEARKLELARKREEELLAARRKYFEERRQAEKKNRELYEHADIMNSGTRASRSVGLRQSYEPNHALSEDKRMEQTKARMELEAEMELETAGIEAQHASAHRRPELLPTNSFVKGQVSDRVWALRRACIDSLGEALFQQVYCMMKARLNGEFGDDDASYFMKEVASLVGRDRLHHIAIMDQLLYFEEKV